MVKTGGGSQTQLYCNLKKSRTHPPESTLPCINCQQEDPCCPVSKGSSPTWGQKRGTQAGDCPLSLGTPHPRRIGGVKEGFDREDPAGNPCRISKGPWWRDMLHHYWHPLGTPALHLHMHYPASIQSSAPHCCQAWIWPQNCTPSSSPAELEENCCAYWWHTWSQSPSHKTYFLISHEMYLIQKSQW